MKTYKVTIEETLRRIVDVKAENSALAISQVEDEYNAEEHVLTAEDFVGVDFSLSNEDTEAKAALSNPFFIEFVEKCFKDRNNDISINDKIKMAFGSIDNALYDFKIDDT